MAEVWAWMAKIGEIISDAWEALKLRGKTGAGQVMGYLFASALYNF
jgi:hypothetical protein